MVDLHHVRHILFLRTDRLGETLLNLPAIVALKQALPHASLTLAAHPELEPLMSSMPGIDRVLPYPQDPAAPWWLRACRFGRLLRRQRFDLAVVSNPKKELHLAVWLAGIPMRVGYDRKWGWLLTRRLPDVKAVGEQHEVEYNLQLLRSLGISAPPSPSFQLSVKEDEERTVSQLLERMQVNTSDCLIAIHPWTSNPLKQWPSDRFRALIRRLGALSGARPILIGGHEERARTSELLGEPASAVLDFVGRLSLREVAALLRKTRVLVSNDSGPMHLAACVGTPVVALFGTEDPGSHPRRWGPWGPGHTVIHKPLSEITVEEVVEAVQRYLHE